MENNTIIVLIHFATHKVREHLFISHIQRMELLAHQPLHIWDAEKDYNIILKYK